jgi:phosphatidylglycerol:prolipoprotein diacylglycerol transferase
MIFSGSGLTWYGGLVGGMLGAFLVARWRRIPLLALCDIAAPLLGLGYAIGRVGCLLNGDDYGKPSNLPWAMTFPKGTPPTTEAVHPAQLYEVIGGLIIFFVLSGLKTRWSRPGALFGLYLLLAGVERFLVEFIRTNEPLLGGMTVAQIMSALLAAGGVAFLARKPSASGLPMNSSAAGDLGGPKSLA